jgi:hypothetical protein
MYPGVHWRRLPYEKVAEAKTSRWPAVLRWLECANLCALERLVLRSSMLRRFVLSSHEQALLRLPIDWESINRAAIVGGGLFPRTAIIFRKLIPAARLTIIDMNLDNIAVARRLVDREVEFVGKRFDPAAPCGFDLLVIPLALIGNREAIYRDPPARIVLVHDWIWRRRGESVVVSPLLLKRINLVRR